MQATQPSIAVIGLGIMGGPIARRLRAAFENVSGYDLSPAARETAESNGVRIAGSVADCVRDADVVFTILPTIEASRHVLDELVQHARPGATWVELGTIGSEAAREHAQAAEAAGLSYLDAPVINGGQPAAEAGTLKVLAGGHAEVLAAVDPFLRSFSTESLHMGPAGTAQTMKLVNNMLLAAIACASAEALALAERAGIGAQRALDILQGSAARSFALDWLFPAAVRGDFSGGAKIDILVKDLHLAQHEARLHHAPAPYADVSAGLFDRCQAEGWGPSDMSIVLKLLSGPAPD